MTETFFISDTHFSHKNIIKFEPFYRPFDTIEEHDQKLIDNWNSVVGHSDIVWHLGDVIWSKDRMWILGYLNGNKKLVLGNHDHFETQSYLKYFVKLYGCLQFNRNIILSHIPVSEQQLSSGRFKYNIHGHLHSKNVLTSHGQVYGGKDDRYINVSCEQIKLTPINFDELKGYMNE